MRGSGRHRTFHHLRRRPAGPAPPRGPGRGRACYVAACGLRRTRRGRPCGLLRAPRDELGCDDGRASGRAARGEHRWAAASRCRIDLIGVYHGALSQLYSAAPERPVRHAERAPRRNGSARARRRPAAERCLAMPSCWAFGDRLARRCARRGHPHRSSRSYDGPSRTTGDLLGAMAQSATGSGVNGLVKAS